MSSRTRSLPGFLLVMSVFVFFLGFQFGSLWYRNDGSIKSSFVSHIGRSLSPVSHCIPSPILTVIIPHFMNLEIATFSLRAMIMRQSLVHCVRYIVISEETELQQRLHVKRVLRRTLIDAFGQSKVEDVATRSTGRSPCTCFDVVEKHIDGEGGLEEEMHRTSLSTIGLATLLHTEGNRSDTSRANGSSLKLSVFPQLPSSFFVPFVSGFVSAEVIDFPMAEVGGASLQRLHQVVNLIAAMRGAEFLVLVDTDVVILAEKWDQVVIRHLSSTSPLPTVLAAINPRSGPFIDQAEWNFLAFRYSFYRSFLNAFFTFESAGQYHDVGHWWTEKAKQAGMSQHLWKAVTSPLSYRSPVIVGDSETPLFALHFFYSSRRYQERISQEERKWMCTNEEYDSLLLLTMTRHLTLKNVTTWTEEWNSRHT